MAHNRRLNVKSCLGDGGQGGGGGVALIDMKKQGKCNKLLRLRQRSIGVSKMTLKVYVAYVRESQRLKQF